MITGIGHAAFGVADLERSLAFYCQGLGLREAFRLYGERGETRIVYIQVAGADFIELFPDRSAAPAKGSYRHLCLVVDDMDRTLEDLGAQGITPLHPKQQGKDHNWQAWLVDPDGNRIELMEISPASPQWAAANGRV